MRCINLYIETCYRTRTLHIWYVFHVAPLLKIVDNRCATEWNKNEPSNDWCIPKFNYGCVFLHFKNVFSTNPEWTKRKNDVLFSMLTKSRRAHSLSHVAVNHLLVNWIPDEHFIFPPKLFVCSILGGFFFFLSLLYNLFGIRSQLWWWVSMTMICGD